jgi:hypothetical protein
MFYTGINPMDMKPVHVVTDYHEKQLQRALLQYNRPENADLVREALTKVGRTDLIGFGPECLVRPAGGRPAGKPSRPASKDAKPQGKGKAPAHAAKSMSQGSKAPSRNPRAASAGKGSKSVSKGNAPKGAAPKNGGKGRR